MKPIVFHRDAAAELDEAMNFYESRRTGLGLTFLADSQQTIHLIEQAPVTWPIYGNTALRMCSLKRFPYVIYFLEQDLCIWIAAVAPPEAKTRLLVIAQAILSN